MTFYDTPLPVKMIKKKKKTVQYCKNNTFRIQKVLYKTIYEFKNKFKTFFPQKRPFFLTRVINNEYTETLKIILYYMYNGN